MTTTAWTAAQTVRLPQEEVTLAVTGSGAAVVEVITDGGRCHVFQYRLAGAVIAEATTLRALAIMLDEPLAHRQRRRGPRPIHRGASAR
jgi:hypothetical protein